MNKRESRKIRHKRVRAKVKGTESKPRLCVFRSLNHIYVQLIDDQKGNTLVSTSSKEVTDRKLKKKEIAAEVGKLVANKALAAGIKEVVFDRGGYKYHGRVQSLAEAARTAGLKF
ncbi:MAG: 50S ribosomal protein L18 [Candidatus Doudnabacteria bacterium]|nr:50S ribosomal protein L18 [Candidatus Doudnabacteria bacterium]